MTKERVIDYLNNELYDYELVAVWNDYCSETNQRGDFIYDMEDFNDYYCDYEPIKISLRLFNSSHFNPNDNWFIIDGYNNPVSTNFPEQYINTVDLAEHIIESEYDFRIDDIREILDSNQD